MAAYRGRDLVVLFNAVDISGTARSISYEETNDVLDDTVVGLDKRTKLAGLGDGSGSFEALDESGDYSAVWDAIVPGATATLQIRPEGTGVGKRQVSVTAIITNRSLEVPYDDLAKFSMSFEFSGVTNETAQSA